MGVHVDVSHDEDIIIFFAIHWRRWPMVASMWQKWIPCLGRARNRQKNMKRHGISSEQFKLFLLTLWKRTRGHVPFLWSLNLQIVVVFRCSFVVSFFALNTIRWEYHVASYKHYNANTLSQFPVIKWYIFTSTFIQNRMWQNDDIWMCVCESMSHLHQRRLSIPRSIHVQWYWNNNEAFYAYA